ncbi:glycosyltransferase family 4 protein [Subtercola boreus]|uniref:glycosyltransferase family 4 protein n=1 Tax=Subtercola boreus TaxID=120213 RepID=UPI0011C0765D|nr:glycosyltransferase family 4 protein [Subtercola boreus]
MSLHDSEAGNPLRIAAVPAGHPYAQHLLDPAAGPGDGIVLLPDPTPTGAADGQWWPPVMLEAEWIRANAHTFDLLHLHFGIESFTLPQLQAGLDALHTAGRPLVFTVHDLTNPQLVDQAPHLAQLDLLVPAADEIITLTAGAAALVGGRWGREAVVIEHPMLAAHATTPSAPGAAAKAPRTSLITIGVHLRDLRPNIDALGTVETLLDAVGVLRESGLDLAVIVDLNERVRDEDARRALRRRTADEPGVELREHPRLSDSELAEALSQVDVEVLPYRHGTHSGWLELCWDLGVAVAAPAVGFFGEQHGGQDEVAVFQPGSVPSMVQALLQLITPIEAAGAERRATLVRERSAWRAEQQRDIHRAHLAVYRRALAAVAV